MVVCCGSNACTCHTFLLLMFPLVLQVLLNEEVGHLVRTKVSTANEGGVAAGFAVLDSPYLAQPGEGLLPTVLEHALPEEAAGQQQQQQKAVAVDEEEQAKGQGVLAAAVKALAEIIMY